MSGHYAPESSGVMENSFADLLERLGYNVLRKRDTKSGLDIIAEFKGQPKSKEQFQECTLLPPAFSPDAKDISAFSLKAGNFGSKDVKELVDKVKRATKLEDEVLKKLRGKVIVTNYSKTETEIDRLRLENIFCWDIRRLIFYSAKAEAIQNLARMSEVEEVSITGIDGLIGASYLRGTVIGENGILTNIVIFVDSHDSKLIVSSDHMTKMLIYICEKSLKTLVKESQNKINVKFEVHILGLANEELLKSSYSQYSRDFALHPKILFNDEPFLFQYASAPWTILFRKH
ncbi:MAG: hypothetical protein ABSB71_09490 [Candidatus Bathyarchaeia archaeon]